MTLGYGNQYYFAYNGQEALGLLHKYPIDIAIVDWNMPVMTGVELLARIRENPRLRDMPVVMVTAEANQEIVAEAAESEIDAYILKPLTAKALESRVLKVIDRANHPPPMFYHLKKARDLAKSGDIPAAIKEMQLAMEADPDSSKPLRELGCLYLKNNDLTLAEEWLKKASQMNKLDVFAFHYLGELYLRKDDLDRAARYFDKAMSISPRHVHRGVNFGKILIQKNMIPRAINVFDKAIKLSDHPLSLQEEIAEFCLEKGIYQYAIDLLSRILTSHPNRADFLFKIGFAHEKIGQNRQALKYLQEAERKDKNCMETKIHLAINYLEIGQVIRAEQVLKTVLEMDPENEEAQKLLKKTV
ncbi:MAG: tetratricopeptide repeat protein [Pseudomonadota bacterium]